MSIVKLTYKPKSITNIIGIIFFGFVGFYLKNVALNNHQGLVINRLVHFEVSGATKVYWVPTVCAGLIAAIFIVNLISNLFSKKCILLTEKSISAPKTAYSKLIVSVPYTEITEFKVQTFNRQIFINILHKKGSLIISKSMLENDQAFERLLALLSVKIKG